MDPAQLLNPSILAYFGLASQTLAIALILVLFLLLRRYAGRRTYFHAWTWSWVALVVGLFALVMRFEILSGVSGAGQEGTWWVRACYFIYQFGKFAFLLLVLNGVLLYLKGLADPPLRYLRWLWLVAVVFTVLSVAISADQRAVMFWQGIVNVLVYAWCSITLLLLPKSRRSLGTRMTGLCLAATALLWVGYETALLHIVFPETGFGVGIWQAFTGRNTYLDLILEMLLAFGMVLVLFEDARREIDTAHNELRIAHEQLLRESFTDSLTGAYNRRALNEGTGLEDARSSFGVLVMFDMDNLKTINDHYGHKYGDALLQYFASVLRAGLRPSDKLYRLGGDEFLVVMPRAVAEVAEQRMQALIAKAAPLKPDKSDAEILLSASIGVASFRSVDELETAMHDADRAMYTSKRARKTAPRNEMPDGDKALPET
ncbi:MAG TPA: GGDEF domain-containing protein [Gammaproteobacteria bacterium]|nr:GGDEF domain-containing protein [Gammaproteobacteria bacterium]